MFGKKKTRRVAFKVICPEDHIFEKVIEVIEGTEEKRSRVQAYCQDCDDYLTVTVQGEVAPNRDILRKFGL